MINDLATHETKIIITKFADKEAFKTGRHYERAVIDCNMLLNEGIAEMWDLVCGLGAPAVLMRTFTPGEWYTFTFPKVVHFSFPLTPDSDVPQHIRIGRRQLRLE